MQMMFRCSGQASGSNNTPRGRCGCTRKAGRTGEPARRAGRAARRRSIRRNRRRDRSREAWPAAAADVAELLRPVSKGAKHTKAAGRKMREAAARQGRRNDGDPSRQTKTRSLGRCRTGKLLRAHGPPRNGGRYSATAARDQEPSEANAGMVITKPIIGQREFTDGAVRTVVQADDGRQVVLDGDDRPSAFGLIRNSYPTDRLSSPGGDHWKEILEISASDLGRHRLPRHLARLAPPDVHQIAGLGRAMNRKSKRRGKRQRRRWAIVRLEMSRP